MQKKPSQFESIFTTRFKMTKQTKKALQKLMKALLLNPLNQEFRLPLQWEKFGLTNYDQIIQKPMDLGTVNDRLGKDLYRYVQGCLDDIELIFQNSCCYNKGNFWIVDLTDKCETLFRKLVKNYLPQVILKETLDKKSLKKIKIQRKMLSKPEIIPNEFQKEETYKQKDAQEQTMSTVPGDQNGTKTAQNLQPSKQCCDLFDLIRSSSEKSLQLLYLIVKSHNMKAISTEKNGNCSIDIKFLSKQLIQRLISFLNEQKSRDVQQAQKEKVPKTQKKKLHEKNRFQV